MIEVYWFLAAFTVQILAISGLIPVRFVRHVRTELTNTPAERLAGMYPGIDVRPAYERILARYRAANMFVAVLGVLLLAWFFRYMRHPDWDEGPVSSLVTGYFVLQNLPFVLIAWFAVRFNKAHGRALPEPRRKAILRRRGLFDFLSPWTALLAILSFLQFAALMFYVARHPFPGFAGPFVNIGSVTLIYAMFAGVLYWVMYGRKKGPLETQEARLRIMRFVVNSYAWTCILIPLFLSLYFARKLLDQEAWMPFGRSVSFLILSLPMLRLRSLAAPRQSAEDGLDSSPAH